MSKRPSNHHMKAFVLCLALLGALPTGSLAARFLPQGYLSNPILIEFPNPTGGFSYGSGFFLAASNHLFLVTARHVLFDPKGIMIATNAILLQSADGTNTGKLEMKVDLGKLQSSNQIKTNSHDVVVVRIASDLGGGDFRFPSPAVETITNLKYGFQFFSIANLTTLENVNVGDDVFVFGYPVSIGLIESPRFDYSKPLLRKGIVSGTFEAGKTIIIDAPVYFGNSGGPVVQVERIGLARVNLKVIGIATELITFADIWESKRFGNVNTNFANSGYSVVQPTDFIIDLLWD